MVTISAADNEMLIPSINSPEAVFTALHNRCLMRLAERIASRFNEAGVPLMALKGAALHLTIYDTPSARAMSDLDLLVKPEDLDRARALLEDLGCLRGQPLVREDFFPRYYYETEYMCRTIYPLRIDLHVRPFRQLRYSRLVPADALWKGARHVRLGQASVLIPSTEDMLIQLAAHVATHGYSQAKWLEDIKRWVQAHEGRINWDKLIENANAWGLILPVRQAISKAGEAHGGVCPSDVTLRMARSPVKARDRLSLWHAPRDAAHPVTHVIVNVLTTPGWKFTLGYLWAVLVPDRCHMEQWYRHRHRAWLPIAHLLRWSWPLLKHISGLRRWFAKTELAPSRIHGIGVFATGDVKTGEVIARYKAKPVNRASRYVGWSETVEEHTQHYEITGKLKFLNHACRPNADLVHTNLMALRPIRAGQEITIGYGDGKCQHESAQDERRPGSKNGLTEAA